MAVGPGHYTISTLAAEFKPTFRTWAKYLANTEPSKVEGRRKYYRLADAIQAIPPHLIGIKLGEAGEELDPVQEGARLKHNQANKVELEVEELRGRLIRVEHVESVWNGFIANCRARLLAIPNALAVRIIGLSLHEAEGEARDAIHEALDELKEFTEHDYKDDFRKLTARRVLAEFIDNDDLNSKAAKSAPAGRGLES